MLRQGTAWLLLSASAAAAAEQSREDAWWTGPMLAPNAASLPQGHALIEPYLFDVISDERERANLAKRHPERLAEMRAAWKKWDATMPPIAGDAGVRLVYGKRDMP